MAEYHVGCGVFGIFAGTLNKSKTMWRQKSDVTEEAINSVAYYLLEHSEKVSFTYRAKKYVMMVVEYKEDTNEPDKN